MQSVVQRVYSRVSHFYLFAWGYVFHITFHTHTRDPCWVHFPLLKEVLLVFLLRGCPLSLGEIDSCWFAKYVFLSKIGVSWGGEGYFHLNKMDEEEERGSPGCVTGTVIPHLPSGRPSPLPSAAISWPLATSFGVHCLCSLFNIFHDSCCKSEV